MSMRRNPQRLTNAVIERKMNQERVLENRHKDLLAFNSGNMKQAFENRSEKQVAGRRRANYDAQIAAERMFEERQRDEQKVQRQQQRLMEQNSKLSAEISRRRAKTERAEREIQRICEESEELKELEQRLKVAYMNQERAAQLDEKALITEMTFAQEQAIADQMEYDRQMGIQEMEENELKRRHHAVEGRRMLEDQMATDNFERMKEAQEQALVDQKLVNSVMRKIEEEDYHEYMNKHSKIRDTKAAIEDYKLQRAEELAAARAREKAETDRILQYTQQKGAREASIKEKQAQRKAEEEARFRSIEAEMQQKAADEKEFQTLRDMLWEEETEARLRKQEEMKARKREDAKQEMMVANEQQKQLKRQLAEQQREEEEELRQMTLAKFEEDLRLDAEAQEKRMRERQVYKKQVKDQADNRAAMYEQEKAAELEARQRLKDEEDFKARVVEEARRRLLQEHARKLGGFLPKGVLKKDSDLSLLAQFDQNNDGTLDASEMQRAQNAFMRYDANQDGKLSEDEKGAAWDALKQGGGQGFVQSSGTTGPSVQNNTRPW